MAHQTQHDHFAGWPRWLRWALFIAVWTVGAFLLKPVGEVGGSIGGAFGAGGLVFLVGLPLLVLGKALSRRGCVHRVKMSCCGEWRK